jgi:enamine deaminase RidA (YjgF/YER057c/UK114 family)
VNESELAAGLPATAQYEYAQRVGHQLFVAGQVPHDASGRLIGQHDAYAQAVQCLKNLNAVMAVHGFATPDVRQLVVYVVGDQANLSAAWKAVTESFKGQVPPRRSWALRDSDTRDSWSRSARPCSRDSRAACRGRR